MSWPKAGTAPTADDMAKLIAAFVDNEYSQPRGGKTHVMESMWHLWEHLLAAADEPTVCVCCTGESPRGSFAEQDELHRVDRSFTVVVIRGHGFRNLMTGEDGAPPNSVETMTQSIEGVRDCVRRLVGLTADWHVNYKGWKNLPAVARPGTANVFTAGGALDFTFAVDIPEIVTN